MDDYLNSFEARPLEEKLEIIKDLSPNRSPESFLLLIKLIYNKDEFVREAVARVFAKRKEKNVFPFLVKLLGDEDKDVSNAAFDSLCELEELKAEELIYYFEKENHVETKIKIIKLLEKLKDETAVNYLIKLLGNSNFRIREKVISSLINTGSPIAVTPLMELINDVSIPVKLKLVRFFGKLKTPEAVPFLNKFLHDRNPEMRYACACSLGEIGAKSSVPVLIKILQEDPLCEVKVSCGCALLKIGSIKALEPLLNFFESTDSEMLISFCNFNLVEIFEKILKSQPDYATPEDIELFKRIKTKLSRYDLEIRKIANKKLSLLIKNSPGDIIILSTENLSEPDRKDIELIT